MGDIDAETWTDLRQHAPQIYYELGEARQGHTLYFDEYEKMPYYHAGDPHWNQWLHEHQYHHQQGAMHSHDMQLKKDILNEVKQHLNGGNSQGGGQHVGLQHKIMEEQNRLQETKNSVIKRQMEWEIKRDMRREQRLARREALLKKEH